MISKAFCVYVWVRSRFTINRDGGEGHFWGIDGADSQDGAGVDYWLLWPSILPSRVWRRCTTHRRSGNSFFFFYLTSAEVLKFRNHFVFFLIHLKDKNR